MTRIASILITLCVIGKTGLAEGNLDDKKITAVRSTETISIDGMLSEAVWQRPGFTNFTQREPEQGAKGTEQSEVWVAYDDAALYIAARMSDHRPDSIVARLVRRDFVYGDPSDGMVFYLDPYHDHMTGYLFYVSAAGTMADGLVENDGRFELSWDAVWEGVSRLREDGYAIEMKIPFSQLRFRENSSQVWGVNFERYIGRKNETAMIVYTPRDESGFVSRFPDLVGIEGISPPARLEVLPYVTAKAEYIGNNPSNPFNPGKKYLPGAGLDLKVGLGTSLTLDGTLNPDFGQVEVDPAVVNLTDVETSFQEKRPFFTEGVSIFRFGQGGTNNSWSFNWSSPTFFYSRRIGRTPQRQPGDYDYADIPNGTRILGAGKISGRIGNDWKVGNIHALTNREFSRIDVGGQRSRVEVEPLTYYGVFRAQRDFDEGQQGIGILSTYTARFFNDQSMRDYLTSNALAMAADGWTFLDKDRTYVLTGWAGVSHVRGNETRMIALQRSSGHYFQRPDAGYLGVDSSARSFTGYAGRLMLNKQRGQFRLNAAAGAIDPRFEVNDLGYSSYSDRLNAHITTGYRWSEPTGYYRQVGVDIATAVSYDFGWNKTSQVYWLGSYITLPNYYGGNVNLSYNPTSLNPRRTRGGPLTLNPASRSCNLDLFTDNRDWWVLNLGGYTETGGQGKSHSMYSNLELKVLPTLTVSFGPEVSRDIIQAQYVKVFSDPAALDTYGRRYVFAHLDQTTVSANVRLNWILTPRLSFQVYLQPFISTGAFTEFKELLKPRSFDFLKYGEYGSTIVPTTSPEGEITEYTLDPDGAGPASSTTVGNPDFNYTSLRGNAVLRWEYTPGSVLFLVWTQSRSDVEPIGDFRFNRSFNRLFDAIPDNIFMLKMSYWWGV